MREQPEPRPVMDVAALTSFIDSVFPQIHDGGRSFVIEAVGPMTSRLRMAHAARHLRPGGTISGPTMFTLADLALYVAVLAHIGPVGLAVTTSMTIDFLRRPEPRDLVAACRLLKLGKRLAVGVVTVFSDGSDVPVAHASGTYSIPAAKNLR